MIHALFSLGFVVEETTTHRQSTAELLEGDRDVRTVMSVPGATYTVLRGGRVSFKRQQGHGRLFLVYCQRKAGTNSTILASTATQTIVKRLCECQR